jgi:hypothetical protein
MRESALHFVVVAHTECWMNPLGEFHARVRLQPGPEPRERDGMRS